VNAAAVKKIAETPELKNVFDYQERVKLLQGAFEVDGNAVAGKRILLVDDLYGSGNGRGAGSPFSQRSGRTHARHDEDPDANMTKVFIAGSRQLSRLNADVKRRIDTMNEKGIHHPRW
jgi:hypothetical protein